jgi:hypothetical protein
MFIVHAATFQEKMTLNFVFSQPAINRQTMERIVDDCISDMIKISSHSSIIGAA